MLHGLVRKYTDAASTVTDLISDLDIRKAKGLAPSCITRKSNAEEHNSSTKLLRRYIREYDRSQTKNLAEVLTCQVHTDTEPSCDKEIDKEINYAKELLGPPTTGLEEDFQSLTMDDLLTMGVCENIHTDLDSNPINFTPSDFDRQKNPTMTAIPQGNYKVMTSSKKPESSSSMRFSEIASRNFFSRTLTATSSTDSNLFSLNGVNYTPHSVKYKSLFRDSVTGEVLEKSPRQRSSSTLFSSESNFDDSCDTITASPQRLTAHAGRTPYKPCNLHRRFLPECDNDGDTLNSSKDFKRTDQESEFSDSHYSVQINLNGETPTARDFMKTCLQEDDYDVRKAATAAGSVETLKNMIFTLQSMNSSDSFTHTKQHVDDSMEIECDTGPASLKKAFSHLATLKDLLA